MSEKIVDFNKTIYELHNEHSDISKILSEIGFIDITKPGMINTAGRFMTIKKGSAAKEIDIEVIKQKFIQNGYEIKL